jgi:hypothetical protein
MSLINDALTKAAKQKESFFKDSSPAKKAPRRWLELSLPRVAFLFLILIGVILISTNPAKLVFKSTIAREKIEEDLSAELPKERIAIPAENKTVVPDKEIVAPLEEVIVPAEKKAIVKDEPPKLSLTGIIYEDKESLALINNRIVREGELIAGARVINIGPNKVILSFVGQEISLFLER